MRLSPDQLPSALQRGIKPVYLVSGDEPLTVGECADAIRAAARAAGYADRTVFFIERGFSWDELHHATQALSLFADRRLFELRMPSGKPDKGAQVLLDIANEPPPDVLTLIVTDKLDRKASEAAWVRAIEKQGAWIPVWPVSADSLPSWLERRAAILGLTLEAPAARIIVERVEGNLLAAKQELEILALLAEGGVIGESLVMRTVGDSARYDVFQLAEAAAAGDAARALRVLIRLERRRRMASGGKAFAARPPATGENAAGGAVAGSGARGSHPQGHRAGRSLVLHHLLDHGHGRRFASVPRFRQGSFMNPMGIFGGTFDPIHYAHLRTAFELQQALRLKEIRFLPAGNPPHRDQPMADAQLRLKMVQLATADQPGFVVDDREVRKEGPSYSVETLGELRHEYPDRSLCLIVGMDAFLSLPKWHQWRELLQLAHLVVAHRPGWRAPGMGPLGELLVDRGTGRIGDLHEQRAGCIYIHAVTQLEISSTEVRQLIAMGRDPRFLMPDSVRKLILDTRCYAKSRTP